MSTEACVINFPVVAAEQFGDEIVVIQFDTGRYFSLGGVAQQVWHLLQTPVTPQAMVGALSEAAGATAPDPAALLNEITTLTDRLVAEGLVLATDATGPMTPIGSFAYAPASLEAYSDLADLVSIDPIHDVDAMMGWPRVGAA